MTNPRDPDALLAAYLADGMEVLPQRVVDSVLDEVHRTRQRTVLGPRRTPMMFRPALVAAVLAALVATGSFLVLSGVNLDPRPSQRPSMPGIVVPSPTLDGPSGLPNPSPVTNPGGIWIQAGTMTTPRYAHTAVRLLDGRVLVLGGASGRGSEGEFDLTSAELYDPASGTWSATEKPVGGGTTTLLHDGKVLVAGEDVAQLYDPNSGTWSQTGKPVVGGDAATLLRDGKVLVAGLDGAQLYDPDSGTWAPIPNMTTPRYYATATLLADGRVLVAGGYVMPDVRTDVAELYDPTTGTWTPVASMNVTDGHHTATLLGDGKVLMTSSNDAADGIDAEVFDPATRTWTTLPVNSDIWYQPTLLSDGTVLMAGARRVEGPEQACTVAELYDPRTGSWTAASSMLQCDTPSSFTLLLDGTVLATGGDRCLDHQVCLATGWAQVYVPAGVAPPPLPTFPPPPPPVFPSPTPIPTPLPPAAGPIPPNARSWTITVENNSSEPATLFVAEEDEHGISELVGSATPNVVPAGATVQVTFRFPAQGEPDEGWIFVNPRPGEGGALVYADQIGIPGKIVITADGQVGWLGL